VEDADESVAQDTQGLVVGVADVHQVNVMVVFSPIVSQGHPAAT
jgi:hypothetical protein